MQCSRFVKSLLLAAALMGCSGIITKKFSAFDTRYPDNDAEQVKSIVARLSPSAGSDAAYYRNALGKPLAFGVKMGQPQMLFAYALDEGKVLWEKPYQLNSRPIVVDNLLVFRSGKEILAVNIQNGARKWGYETKAMDFYGAAGSDGRVILTLGLGGQTAVGAGRRGLVVGLSASSGLKLWSHEMENTRMGEAASVNNMVFVPWDTQNISVLDGASGVEICRIRTKDDVFNFVVNRPEGIYYGSRGLYRFDARSWTGKKNESTFYEVPLKGSIPGAPELLTDKLVPITGLSTARDKIRFFWSPVLGPDQSRISFVDDSIYLLYYRFLYSFDAATGKLKWVFRNKLDIEDVQVVPGGLHLIDKKGQIVFIEASRGDEISRVETGANLITGILDVGRFKPNFSPPTGEPEALRLGLINLILDNDNRLVPIRKYTLSFLAVIPDPEVTKDLLDVYIQKGIPKEMKEVARDLLLGRESGAAYLVDSMKYHYDYLDEMIPPPMGVVAQALVKMNAKEGVPGLLQHLLDHETPPADMREIANALLQLGDVSILPTVKEFLIRYHADSTFKDELDTMVTLVKVVHTFGSEEDRGFLRKMEKDPDTLAALSGQIDKVFKDYEQSIIDAKLAAEKAKLAEAHALEDPDGDGIPNKDDECPLAAGPAAEKGCPVKGPEIHIPQMLTQKQISIILSKHAAEFGPCIQEYVAKNPETAQIRLKFIITNKGKAEKLMTLPSDPKLSSCLLTKIVKVEFPPIKSLKQNAQYVIMIKKPEAGEEEDWPPTPTPGGETPPGDKPPPPDTLPPEDKPPEDKPPTWLPQPDKPPEDKPPEDKPPGDKPPGDKPPGGDYPDQLYPDELPE